MQKWRSRPINELAAQGGQAENGPGSPRRSRTPNSRMRVRRARRGRIWSPPMALTEKQAALRKRSVKSRPPRWKRSPRPNAQSGPAAPKFTADQVGGEFFQFYGNNRLVRGAVFLDGHPRIDGRDTKTRAPHSNSAPATVLARNPRPPRCSPAAGKRQALVVYGRSAPGRDAQIIDGLTGETQRAVSCCTTIFPSVQPSARPGMMGSPKRRENRTRQSGPRRGR